MRIISVVKIDLFARGNTKDKGCKESPNGICPPDQLRQLRLGHYSGNIGPSARQTSEAGPSTCRSTHYAPPLWCGHQSPTCTSVELATASLVLVPNFLGWVSSGEKKTLFFSNGNWWDLNQ